MIFNYIFLKFDKNPFCILYFKNYDTANAPNFHNL